MITSLKTFLPLKQYFEFQHTDCNNKNNNIDFGVSDVCDKNSNEKHSLGFQSFCGVQRTQNIRKY